jgi:hypothetical protein
MAFSDGAALPGNGEGFFVGLTMAKILFSLFLLVAGVQPVVREVCVYTHEGIELFCWLEVER